MNIDKYKNYLVTSIDVDGENLDYDRCTYVWNNFYRPFYSNIDFWKNADFKDIKKGCINYHGVDCNGHSIVIQISGDASFNFKKGLKRNKKYEYFKKLIERDYFGKERQQYFDDLNCCESMLYSFHNFALMPKTGGMNNSKASRCDRLDKFLFFLDKYYKDYSINNPIFSHARGNKILLERFLHPIASVYKYCEYFYLIKDKDCIDRLIENGKTTIYINSGKAVVDYMKLAKDFWAKRHNIIQAT